MSETNSERVTCPDCGKGYRWQDALAGRTVACKQCGTQFTVPDAPGMGLALEPTNDDGIYDLETPEIDQPRQLTAPAVGGKCPNCNSPVKEHAVICINCGFDMQQGRKIEKPQVSELSPEDRRESEKIAKAPLRGMVWVRTGLWLHFLEIILVIVTIPIAIFAAFASFNEELIINVLTYLAFAIAIAGSALCLAAPKQSNARPILIVSIVLILIATVTEFLVDQNQIPVSLSILSNLMRIAGTACFLYFFVRLARFLDFQEITDRAEKVLGLYIMVQLGFFLMLLPVIGCFLVLLVLAAGIYWIFLYLMLLIDLNNALSYRIGEHKAEQA